MDKIIERVFKNLKPDFEKLTAYGFAKQNEAYVYATELLDGQFNLTVTVSGGEVGAEVTDADTGEAYTLFLADSVAGGFIGSVKSAYENALFNVARNCFYKSVFNGANSQDIVNYIKEKYGDEPEFLWEKYDDNAVFRRKDNGKWYGVILKVTYDKLGLSSNDTVEILDLKIDPNTTKADEVKTFKGYHMNKTHWITVLLDGSFPLSEIKKMTDVSYGLAKTTKKRN